MVDEEGVSEVVEGGIWMSFDGCRSSQASARGCGKENGKMRKERLFNGVSSDKIRQIAGVIYDLKNTVLVTVEEEVALSFALECIGAILEGTEGKNIKQHFRKIGG